MPADAPDVHTIVLLAMLACGPGSMRAGESVGVKHTPHGARFLFAVR